VKPHVAANLALALVSLGWFALAYSVLTSLGDIDPKVPSSVVQFYRRSSLSIGFTGVSLLVFSIGLASYALPVAPKRAIAALVMFAVPFLGFFVVGLQ
jgi:hypothetical protein